MKKRIFILITTLIFVMSAISGCGAKVYENYEKQRTQNDKESDNRQPTLVTKVMGFKEYTAEDGSTIRSLLQDMISLSSDGTFKKAAQEILDVYVTTYIDRKNVPDIKDSAKQTARDEIIEHLLELNDTNFENANVGSVVTTAYEIELTILKDYVPFFDGSTSSNTTAKADSSSVSNKSTESSGKNSKTEAPDDLTIAMENADKGFSKGAEFDELSKSMGHKRSSTTAPTDGYGSYDILNPAPYAMGAKLTAYTGNFKDGKYHGLGTLANFTTGVHLTGEWTDGVFTGYGRMGIVKNNNFTYYYGYFEDGVMQGLGSKHDNTAIYWGRFEGAELTEVLGSQDDISLAESNKAFSAAMAELEDKYSSGSSGGSGSTASAEKKSICPICRGLGKITIKVPAYFGTGGVNETKECTLCDGTGIY